MEQLKGLVTSQYIKERRPYAIFRDQKHRLASFCATGNQQRILTDISGTRRWLCYLVQAIDNPREWDLDYEQLYAQLYQEYQQGFQYFMSKAEEAQLETNNKPFRQISPEEEAVMSRLRKPKGNEAYKRMTATMISQLLSGGVNHGLSIKKIGQVMHQKKFRTINHHGYELYVVVEIPYDQQQNYLSSNIDEGESTAEECSQLTEPEQLDLPF